MPSEGLPLGVADNGRRTPRSQPTGAAARTRRSRTLPVVFLAAVSTAAAVRARRSRALPAAFLAAISVAAVLGPSATAHAQEASGAPPVVWVLATGGTISGGGQSSTSLTQYRSGAFSGEQLVSAVPAIAEHATVRVEQIVNIGSPNITFDDWLTLARRIDEIFSGDPDAAGVVVTHGTNTLEETAYFLNLTVRHDRPVVLAGTQRPATAISTDGPLNSRPAGWNRRTQKRAEENDHRDRNGLQRTA